MAPVHQLSAFASLCRDVDFGQVILQPVRDHVSHFLVRTEDESMSYFFLTEPNISFWKLFLYVFIVLCWTPSIYSSIVKCKLRDKTKTWIRKHFPLPAQIRHQQLATTCFTSPRAWPWEPVPRLPPESSSLKAVSLHGLWEGIKRHLMGRNPGRESLV